MGLVGLMGVVVCVLVLQVQLVWMVSVFVNWIVVERIVEMMGVVVLVVLVLSIISVLVVSVSVFLRVLMDCVGLMGVGVFVLVRILSFVVMVSVLILVGVRM
jgi:hypothetical protein